VRLGCASPPPRSHVGGSEAIASRDDAARILIGAGQQRAGAWARARLPSTSCVVGGIVSGKDGDPDLDLSAGFDPPQGCSTFLRIDADGVKLIIHRHATRTTRRHQPVPPPRGFQHRPLGGDRRRMSPSTVPTGSVHRSRPRSRLPRLTRSNALPGTPTGLRATAPLDAR